MNWPNFALMNGQQAPLALTQASRLSPVQTASINIKRTSGGTISRIKRTLKIVIVMLNGPEMRCSRAQPINPRFAGGGRLAAKSSRRTNGPIPASAAISLIAPPTPRGGYRNSSAPR